MGYTAQEWGVWRHESGDEISLFTDAQAHQKSLHAWRLKWRDGQFAQWLKSRRIDAGLAREAGVRLTCKEMERLRRLLAKLPEHARQVAVGGMHSSASRSPNGIPRACPDCRQSVAPTSYTCCGSVRLF
eukprot:5835080-Alexandrium_andersonii.AAC.1